MEGEAVPPGAVPPGGKPGGKPGAKPAAKPAPVKETEAEITLSPPLSSGSDELQAATVGELRRRVSAAGLNDAELELLLSLYQPYLFESDDMVLLFRWPQAAIDEALPLSIEPDTAKVRRVAIVIARKVDPALRADIGRLITELGSATYEQREAAEKQLTTLGRLAIPLLTAAVENTDPEIASRAERILLVLQPQAGAGE